MVGILGSATAPGGDGIKSTWVPSLTQVRLEHCKSQSAITSRGYWYICCIILVHNKTKGIWILFTKDIFFEYEFEYYSWHFLSQI